MLNYRRLIFPGGEFFFTVNLLDRRQSLLTENTDLLRAAYGYVQRRHPFETVAICVPPDHLHCIRRLPPEGGVLISRSIVPQWSRYVVTQQEPMGGQRHARLELSRFFNPLGHDRH